MSAKEEKTKTDTEMKVEKKTEMKVEKKMEMKVEKKTEKKAGKKSNKKTGKSLKLNSKSKLKARKRLQKKQPLKAGVIRLGRAKKAIIKKILKPHLRKLPKKIKSAPTDVKPTGKKNEKKPKDDEKEKKKPKDDEKEEKQPAGDEKEEKKPTGEEKDGKKPTTDGKGKKTRTVSFKKAPQYYPTEVRRCRTRDKKKASRQYLKKTLTSGTLCVVLSGPHKGKRVVFLKQLKSGFCLVTGPFILNRCPLRRINQIYLIGTSTKIDLGANFTIPENIDDAYFKKVKLSKKKPKKEEDIFNTKSKKCIVTADKKANQKIVDQQVLKAIKSKKTDRSVYMYLSSKFSLKNHQYPHALKF